MSTEESPRRNRFVAALESARRGNTMNELDEGIAKVLEAVRRTGKTGAVHLSLRLGLASKGDDGVITVTDSVRLMVPENDRGVTVMYATDDNALQRNDPRQLALDIAKPEAKPEAIEQPPAPAPLALVKQEGSR